MKRRIYRVKDIEMVLALKRIIQNMRNNQKELVKIRRDITPEFLDKLEGEVDEVIEKYLGLDKNYQLRKATKKLGSLYEQVMGDVGLLKTALEVDFPGETEELKKRLGFSAYYTLADNGDQEGLQQLLLAVRKGMTEELKERFIETGYADEWIEQLMGYPERIESANLKQESMKDSKQYLTHEAIEEMNRLYSKVMGFAKLFRRYYKFDPMKRDQFIFSRVVRQMNMSQAKSDEEAETEE
jgi:plasmid maintenance system antidote protein VapI